MTLGCIYMYRFLDSAIRMKEAVTGGLIGQRLIAECTGLFYRDQPYYDSGAWRGRWETEGGGSLVTQTSHSLDLMIWMLGDVESVAAFYSTSPLHRIDGSDRRWHNPRTRKNAVLPDWGGRDLKIGTLRSAVGQLGIDWQAFRNV